MASDLVCTVCRFPLYGLTLYILVTPKCVVRQSVRTYHAIFHWSKSELLLFIGPSIYTMVHPSLFDQHRRKNSLGLVHKGLIKKVSSIIQTSWPKRYANAQTGLCYQCTLALKPDFLATGNKIRLNTLNTQTNQCINAVSSTVFIVLKTRYERSSFFQFFYFSERE